jgi:ABC-type oligopeptide transport system ATPase subunit
MAEVGKRSEYRHAEPEHAYTRALLGAAPALDWASESLA